MNKLNKKLETITEEEIKKLKKKGKFGKRKKDKNVEVVPVPTTKECPYCFTEINIHATRCPHCTSVLEQKEEAKEEQTIE